MLVTAEHVDKTQKKNINFNESVQLTINFFAQESAECEPLLSTHAEYVNPLRGSYIRRKEKKAEKCTISFKWSIRPLNNFEARKASEIKHNAYYQNQSNLQAYSLPPSFNRQDIKDFRGCGLILDHDATLMNVLAKMP